MGSHNVHTRQYVLDEMIVTVLMIAALRAGTCSLSLSNKQGKTSVV
jgi:hypothetical protein